MEKQKFIQIDIDKYQGSIPKGSELVIAEKGNEEETALVLHGFDETEYFKSDFNQPVYGFLTL